MKKKHQRQKWCSFPVNLHAAGRLVTCLLVLAAISLNTPAYSQQTGRISLEVEDVSLAEFIREIESRSDYVFYYEETIPLDKRVSVKMENASVEALLDKVLTGGYSYKINNRQVLLQFDPVKEAAAGRQDGYGTVTGTVKDPAGEPMPGVAVVVKGSALGATTGVDGRYTLSRVPAGEHTVEISFLGYQPLNLAVRSLTRDETRILDATLVEGIEINTVVVTALGITREEKSLGYAVSKLDNEDITKAATGNWLSGLAGKVAGLNFDQSSSGPGGSIRVTLRGEGSLSHDKNTALFVVDGIPINSDMEANTTGGGYDNNDATIDYGNGASDLNPDDIAEITVLKGPAATALYGSRAGNGAIIITTKSGRQSKGIGVTFSSGVSFERAGFWPDFQNEYGAGDFRHSNSAWTSSGLITPPEYRYWTADGISRFHSRYAFGQRYDADFMTLLYGSKNWETGELTPMPFTPMNWYKGFFETGVTYTNSVSVDSNNGKGTTVRVSAKDTRNDWIVPNTGYKTQNVSFSLSHEMNKFMKLNAKTTYYRKNSDNLPMSGYSNASPLYALIWEPVSVSTKELADEYFSGRIDEMYAAGTTGSGNIINVGSDNPYRMAYENLNTMARDRVYGNVSLNISLLKDKLDLMLRSGLDFSNDFRTQRKPFYSVSAAQGMYREQTVRFVEFNNDFLLSYRDRFGDFSLDASFGGNNMVRRRQNNIITAPNLQEPGKYTLANNDGGLITSLRRYEKSVNSFYGIASLGWRDMLFVDLTGRNDWSSTLAPGNNSYFYPSVSVSALVDQIVDLREYAPWVNMLKLRGSWANVGRDTDEYRLDPVYSNSDFDGAFRMPSEMLNYNIKPENVESWEAGIEARLFDNKWQFDVTYYSAITTNQIINVPTDQATGASSQVINAGKVTNKGVEISTTIRALKTNDWNWTINLNWSRNWNKLVELADGVELWQLNSRNTVGSRVFVYAYPGQELGRIYGVGFQRAPKGAYYVDEYGKKVDVSGEVIVDPTTGNPVLSDDLQDFGSIYPDWKAGMTQNIRYKNITLSMTFSAQVGGNAYSVTNFGLSYMGKLKNTLPGRYEGLVHKGVNVDSKGNYSQNTTITTDIADYYNLFIWPRNNVETNTFDTSYLKFKELRLSYTFPKSILSKLKVVQGLQVGAYATNLFCWTNWPQYDPDVASFGNGSLNRGVETGGYPMTRTWGFDVKLNF